MVLNGNIKGQGAIRAFFGIIISKNEYPSKQNDILVVVKVTMIISLFDLSGHLQLGIWCEFPHCVEDRNATS